LRFVSSLVFFNYLGFPSADADLIFHYIILDSPAIRPSVMRSERTDAARPMRSISQPLQAGIALGASLAAIRD
jgi:hypothetical protein